MCHYYKLFSTILNYSCENNENNWENEDYEFIVSPCVSSSWHFLQYPCSYVAARLKGEFCDIARISASCPLRQIVYAVLPA